MATSLAMYTPSKLLNNIYGTDTKQYNSNGALENYSGPTYDTSGMTPEQWQNFGAGGGIIGDNGNMLNSAGKSIGTLQQTSGISMPSLSTLGTGIGVAQGLAGIYLGNQQLGIAKDRLAMDKDRYAYLIGQDKKTEAGQAGLAANFEKAYANRTV